MDTDRFKQRLLDLREELRGLEDTNRDAAGTVELDQTRVGRLSRMDALQAQAMSKEARRRRELQLRRIEPALRRLESGDYGRCADCDEAIAPARLEFDPTCTTCIACAEGREQH